jgi:uncharacterized protein YndB with AHSA1/START domain
MHREEGDMPEPIHAEVTVPLRADDAFARFTRHLDRWWPRDYTWSKDVLEEIGMERREGGLCFERGPHGFRCDWGRILEWKPPGHLVFTWQIGPHREPVPDPERASIVHVTFAESAEGDSTHVVLQHTLFERHGEGAEAYREALASAHGWPFILECYANSV